PSAFRNLRRKCNGADLTGSGGRPASRSCEGVDHKHLQHVRPQSDCWLLPLCPSKAALEHLTRCWALELGPHAVRVTARAAGPAKTAALVEMMGLSPEQAEGVKEHERKLIPLT